MVNTADAAVKRRETMAAIKGWLERQERTQAWLIRRLEEHGVDVPSKQTFCNWINGHRRVPRVVLAEICAITGTSLERLLTTIDEALLIQAPQTRQGRTAEKAATERRKTASVA